LGERRGGRDSVAISVAAARARMVAWFRILPHTHVQQLMAGSPEEVSEECCLGEVCSLVAGAEIEVAYMTGTPRMRVPVVSEEVTVVSRIVLDAPSRSRKHPAPVSDHGWE
jgi:hypothetical protein